MGRLTTDPLYAARRAQEMHERAAAREAMANDERLSNFARAALLRGAERAKKLAEDYDAFVR